MNDKELITLLYQNFEAFVIHGDTYFPTQDDLKAIKEELEKRGIEHFLDAWIK